MVAEVRRTAAFKRGDASLDGRPALVLMVNKQPDVDTPRVTREVEQRMEAPSRIRPRMLPGFGQWTVSVSPSRVSISAKKRL